MHNDRPSAVRTPLVSSLLAEEPDMRDLVEEFITGLEERAGEFAAAFADREWDRLRVLAHQLKGAGGSYGYPEFSALGATMETAFRNHAGDGFEQWMRELGELVAAARAALADTPA